MTKIKHLNWLIATNPHSSIENFLIGMDEGQGTSTPVRFLKFLLEKEDKVNLVIPLRKNLKRLFQSRKNLRAFQNLFIEPITYSIGWKRIFNFFEIYTKIYKLSHRKKIDVAYITGYNIIPAMLALGRSTPIFARFYGTFLTSLLENNYKLKHLPKLYLELLSFKIAAKSNGVIITDDGTQGDEVCNKLNIPTSKILFLKNGIDWEIIDKIRSKSKNSLRKKYKVNPDDFIILQVSRLASWKRVDLVIQAFNELYKVLYKKNKTLTQKIKLLIIGDGNEKKRLKMLASSLMASKNIYFLGEKRRLETLEYMALSDIITSFYEISNVGNVLLEALSLGKLVIARNTGNTSSIIKNGINGFLLRETPELLIQDFLLCMEEIISNTNKRVRIETNALLWAKRNLLDWKERLEKEYEWILQRLY